MQWGDPVLVYTQALKATWRETNQRRGRLKGNLGPTRRRHRKLFWMWHASWWLARIAILFNKSGWTSSSDWSTNWIYAASKKFLLNKELRNFPESTEKHRSSVITLPSPAEQSHLLQLLRIHQFHFKEAKWKNCGGSEDTEKWFVHEEEGDWSSLDITTR